MSIYYKLLGRPISNSDHAAVWKKEGLSNVVIRLEFQNQPGRKVRKATAYAGDHALTIDSWTLRPDEGNIDSKERIEKLHGAVYRAALQFEKQGLRCRMNGQPAADYVQSNKFLGYVSRLL